MILGLFKNKLNEEDHKHVINYIVTEEANQQWIYHVLENNFNKESFRGLPFAKNVLNSFVTMNLNMKASDEMLGSIADLGYRKCREWLDKAIELIKPGVSTDTVAKVWPKAEEFGFSDEMQAFGLQFGHGLGLALHERPIISRLVSLENPMEIKTGMVFALETYCPAKDGVSAARIEEEVVVTDKGCKVISLFPAEDLPIANKY